MSRAEIGTLQLLLHLYFSLKIALWSFI